MRADRLLSLMLVLHVEGHLTAADLSTRLGVSERTIYRDVEALSLAGIPVFTQSGTNGGVFLDEHYRILLTGLSIPEIHALFVAGDTGPLADLGLATASEGSVLKLLAALPAVHRHEVAQLRHRFYIDTASWFQFGEAPLVLPTLQQAVWEDRRISLTYTGYDGQSTEYTLDAYALVAKANVWYLIGRKIGGDPRTYRVSRIVRLGLTDEYFARDTTFDLTAYWREASQNFEQMRMRDFPFYPTVLCIAPDALIQFRNYIPDRFEQRDQPSPNGWLTVRVLFLSAFEAQKWVLGLGIQVRVIEPIELQQMVIDTAKAIVALHSKS